MHLGETFGGKNTRAKARALGRSPAGGDGGRADGMGTNHGG